MNRVAKIAALHVLLILCASRASAQEATPRSEMLAHYDAAYRLQSAGKLDQADRELMAFLVAALGRLANGYANTGDYAKAKLTFEEALRLAQDNADILHDYASAALNANDNATAAELLLRAIASTSKPVSRLAELHSLQGKLQIATKGRQADLTEFRTAVELDASCDNINALANAELAVSGPAAAEGDYKHYRSRCGNTPATRINIGRAYAINDFPEQALVEFRAAAALDSRFPHVHYCIGAAYLQGSKSNFDAAEAELRKELELHPNDGLSYAQLGHIAIIRHHDHEAEQYYRRAIALDPQNPSNYIQLGQLLAGANRNAEAEPLLLKAIGLTPDASRNNYAIERAHFQLGRILMKEGHQEDAQREFGISADLLNQSRHQAEADLSGNAGSETNPLAITRIRTRQEEVQVGSYLHDVTPFLAGAYNNLGVHAANAGNLSVAVTYFALAAQWNPALQGVDKNWGRAA